MKPHDSIWVMRRWCCKSTDPVRGCLDNPEGLNNGHLPSWHAPRVHELANGLRLGIVVPKIGFEGSLGHYALVRASKGKYLSIGPDKG
jgi:hypothetical protein